MPEATIAFMGQIAQVACDGQCNKAWGVVSRPSFDGYFLSDNELREAPVNPGTSEGGVVKPFSALYFPTKWCVRQCERCVMSAPGNPESLPPLPDYSARRLIDEPLYATE